MHKRNAPAMGFIFITLLLDVTGLGIIIPVMPRLIQEMKDVPLSDAAQYGGWLMFSFAIMQFLFAPVLGSLSDRFGRRPVLLASLFGFGVDYLVLALAPTIGWLFVGRIFAGISGASITTASAYIADISPPEKRAQNFGLIGAAFGIGFIIGPVVGGLLGQFGSRVPFYAAAILTLLNCLYGYFVLPESLALENRRPFSWKRANPVGALLQLKRYPMIIGLFLSLFLVYLASHAVQSTWSYFTMEEFQWNEAQVGYSLGFVGLLVGLVQGVLIRYISPKLGAKKSVITGFILYTIGLVLFAFAQEGWMMYVFLVPYCLGGIAGPSLQGLLSNQIPANEQGELQGMVASLMSLSAIIGPPVMTNLFSFFTSANAPFLFAGAPFMLAAMLVLTSLFFVVGTLRKHH
jgi:DHA1 family tetracycline resistance protein-like MFS transporter